MFMERMAPHVLEVLDWAKLIFIQELTFPNLREFYSKVLQLAPLKNTHTAQFAWLYR